MQRAIALAVMAVIAGAPAMEGLCAALCLTSVTHGASVSTSSEPQRHGPHHAVPAALPAQSALAGTAPRVHEHEPVGTHAHDSSQGHDPQDATTAVVVVTAVDANCCVDPSLIVTPAVSGARQDASVLAASAHAALTIASLSPLTSQRSFDAIPSSSVSPPSPTRAPLVLRI